MGLVELPRVVADKPGRAEFAGTVRPIRELTRAIATEPGTWTPERAAQIGVLADDGVLLWVSTNGDETPIYLAPADGLRALPGKWEGISAQAGWGTWLTARRAR